MVINWLFMLSPTSGPSYASAATYTFVIKLYRLEQRLKQGSFVYAQFIIVQRMSEAAGIPGTLFRPKSCLSRHRAEISIQLRRRKWTKYHTTRSDDLNPSTNLSPLLNSHVVFRSPHQIASAVADNMVEQLAVSSQHYPSLQEVVQGLDDTQLAASLRGIDAHQVQRIVQCLRGNRHLDQGGRVILSFNISLCSVMISSDHYSHL